MLSLDTLSLRIKNTFNGHLKENIFFLHIPKCGGTSLDHAIKSRYQTLDLRSANPVIGLGASASSNVIKMICQTDYPNDTKDDYPILELRENLLL